MRIDILTLFPEMCEKVMSESIVGRARKNKIIDICCHNIRDYTYDKHNRVDDTPYGGGMGMLIMAEPISACFESICKQLNVRPKLIYMSPQGSVLTQKKVLELSQIENIAILCGHYEGVDKRLIEEYDCEEISIGDYVVTGGELPALVLADAISRVIPGVLSSSECFEQESHYNGLLEYPQYTRPYEWRGRKVPEVLISGHHENIKRWRMKESIKKTMKIRPDLISKVDMNEEVIKLLNEIEFKDNSKIND